MGMRSKIATMSVRLALWGAASLAIQAGAAAAQSQTVNLNIPAQDLGRALNTFARQSNQQLLYSPDLVRGRRAPALAGSYAPDQALRKLLNDSGISVSRTANGAFVLAAAQPAPGGAQPARPPQQAAPAPAKKGDEEQEIVITGTQIRGIAPAGANVISVGQQEIQESGAARGNDILANVPQISNFFNAMPDVGGNNPFGINAAPIQRPNLRSLPGNNVNSGSLTLILMDGHRVTPSGLTQIAVDPDIVPSALLERVELMPDGASAVYGSDALGGVINFITRKSFNGVEGSARYGFAKNGYNAWDASITAGKDWGSGSAFISFSFSYHDPIFGKDRDFIKAIEWNPASKNFGLGTERSCEPGNIQIGGNFYPLSPDGTILGVSTPTNATLPNACDPSDLQTFYSRDRRRSFFAGFSQQLTDSIRLDIRGFTTRRTSTTFGGPFRTSFNILRTSPLYRSVSGVPGAPAGDFAGCDVTPRLSSCPTETVRFSYQNVLPIPARTNILDTWQITPALTWDVGSKWQVRALATYGKNQTGVESDAMSAATQTARLNAGIINPFNVDASAPGAFDNLVFLSQTQGHITFQNYRLLADGPLFTLPGGDVHIAAGAEYISIDFSRRQTDPSFVLGPPLQYKQTVKAVFGELQIPIVGPGNRFSGVYSLSVQGSVRRDKYNDFGSTTNPSIGVTYEPVSWVKFRGIWGKSFVAPSATAQLGRTAVGLIVMGTSQTLGVLDLPAGAPPPPPGAVGLLLNMGSIGGLPGETLGPQTSKNWSIGGEIRPPFVPGLSLSATLYNIKVSDILATPVSQGLPAFYPQFPTLFTLAPPGGFTAPQIAQWIGLATPASQAFYLQSFANTSTNPVVILVDNRLRNLGSAHVKGVDFAVNYRKDVGFGTIDLSIAGNRELVSTTQNGAGLAVNDLLALDEAKWKWAAGAGLSRGKFRGKLTWNHTGGFKVNPALNAGQTSVKAFNTVDAFLSYDLGGFGIVQDVQLTLNVNNMFDQDPPILRRAGFQNFGFSPTVFTVGRFIQFGIRTKL
jgi:iron complex outermembrane receptor protein